jgi:hypothetical protein
MNKWMHSVAGLSLASLLIIACCGSAACADEATSPPAKGAGGDAKLAPGKFSLQEFNERIVKAQGNRMKWILFRNLHNAPCFRLTGLLYGSGDLVGVVVPNYAMDGVSVGRGPGEALGEALNPASFLFANSVCRFTITISKFALRNGVESLVPPRDQTPDAGALVVHGKAKLPSDSAGSANTDGGRLKPGGAVEVHGNRLEINSKASDPNMVGTSGLGASFGSSQPPLTFSGIVWLGSNNFSLYLGNAPADMTIESRKNAAAKAYEIDISMPDARMRLSVRKDILQDGSWIPDFDD